jgi:hypothetical protein
MRPVGFPELVLVAERSRLGLALAAYLGKTELLGRTVLVLAP